MKVTFSENNESKPETLSVYNFLSGINNAIRGYTGRIEGEVTSVKATYATAIYFTIKDRERDALLNCVIWRSVYDQNGVPLKEGDAIIVTGTPEIYVQRGSFSLKVITIEYAGEGALKKAYDELRQKLTSEGLLDPAKKRLLPKYPKKIGVITSRSGVVIQDFNSNLGRYGFETMMVDSRVEGKDAIHELLAALRTLAKQDIDILVIMRGGGSWESLQAFNTESVVRAIATFKCPVLTGIGHDVDVTLAELVADVGASTPTAVAEQLNQSWDTLTSSLDTAYAKVIADYARALGTSARSFDGHTSKVMRRFEQQLIVSHKALAGQSLAIKNYFKGLEKTIIRASSAFLSAAGILKGQIRLLSQQLRSLPAVLLGHVESNITESRIDIDTAAKQLAAAQLASMLDVSNAILVIEKTIRLSDPARNLKLGYSLTYKAGKLLRSVAGVKEGEEVEMRLADGAFTSVVKNVQ